MSRFSEEHVEEFAELLVLADSVGLIRKTRFNSIKLGAFESYRPKWVLVNHAFNAQSECFGVILRDRRSYEEIMRLPMTFDRSH